VVPTRGDGNEGAGAGEAAATVVTLLFTDLVGSSSLLEQQGEEGAERTRRAHFRILREAIAEGGGHEVKNLGDGLMVAFTSALEAVRSAIGMQRAIARYNASATDPLQVRVGLHVGEPIRDEDDYFGTPVVVASRLCDAASGSQILASDLVRGLVAGRGGIEFSLNGELQLKGLTDPVRTYSVAWIEPEPTPMPGAVAAPQTSKMVGRHAELAVIDQAFARTCEGTFNVVLVTGEPGVGKSRLSLEFEARGHHDVLTLVARAHPFGAAASFGLWVEALDAHLRSLEAVEVLSLAGSFTSELSAILPSVAAASGSYPDAEPPRVRLLAALGGLMGNLAARHPLVISLDDVHLADTSSWEALVYLAGRLRAVPILVVLLARPGELAALDVPRDVLASLEHDGRLSRLSLDALDSEQVRQLTADALGSDEVPAALVDWLMARAKGSPLFTLGLVRALVEEGGDLERPELHSLPEDLTERVAARLRGLDAASLSVLEILAVMAHRVDLGDLIAITGRPLDVLADLLEQLERARFVVEDERGRELTYEILHPLVQEAIYRNIGGARRRAVHRLVGRTLVAAGRPGSAAPHFVRSADRGDPETIDALKEALRQAEARELSHEALTVLDALLDLLPAHDQRWIGVLDAMAWQAEWVVEHRADRATAGGIRAMRVLENLLEGRHDPGRLAVVKFHLSSFLTWGTGEVAEGRRKAEEALELFRHAGDARAAHTVANELGYITGIEGDLAGHERIARERVTEAEVVGDRGLEMQALISLLWGILFRAAEPAEARRVLEQAHQIAQEDGKRYRAVYLSSMRGLLSTYDQGASAGAAHFQSAFTDVEMYPQTLTLEFALIAAHLAGDYTRGADLARELVSTTGSQPGLRRAWGTGAAAACLAELGRLAEADRVAAIGDDVFEGRDWWVHSDVASWGRGAAAALAGRTDEALAILERAATRQARMGSWLFGTNMAVDLAELGMEAARPDAVDAAISLLDGAELVAPWQQALAAMGEGCRAVVGGSADECAAAISGLNAACATFRGLEWRGHQARTDVLLARCLVRSDRGSAAEALERAIAMFDACGATVRAERARQALGDLGGRRQSPSSGRPGGLTRREREVVDLALEGLPAKEIAQRLFIGERTVESHLGRAYAKLGVSSRVELVRKATALGLEKG